MGNHQTNKGKASKNKGNTCWEAAAGLRGEHFCLVSQLSGCTVREACMVVSAAIRYPWDFDGHDRVHAFSFPLKARNDSPRVAFGLALHVQIPSSRSHSYSGRMHLSIAPSTTKPFLQNRVEWVRLGETRKTENPTNACYSLQEYCLQELAALTAERSRTLRRSG